jgi:Domain of unknown function (DUF4062)
MSRTTDSAWNNLIVEDTAHPAPLSDERFRDWMTGRRVFVSSTMNTEMTPFREAVRAYLHRMGASPIMWEEITPRDESPQQAYLTGVDRSVVFVLLLGGRYGVTDGSGYSPTHQESNRAAERRIPRLLFTLASVKNSERDGRLNDWLRSLYGELAAASFSAEADLVAQLDARLREMAARSERVWIKLGNLVFPGTVTSRFEGTGGGEFVVTARVRAGGVRHALLEYGQPFGPRSRAERLTWADNSFPTQVQSVTVETEYTGEDVVRVTCRTPQNWHGGSESNHAMLASFGSVTAAEMATMWARRAILGQEFQDRGRGSFDLTGSFSEPDAATLPQVLRAQGASGWLAEGLTRLYVVEEVSRRYGGHFGHLEVGPAVATGVRIQGRFTFDAGMGSHHEHSEIEGLVTFGK